MRYLAILAALVLLGCGGPGEEAADEESSGGEVAAVDAEGDSPGSTREGSTGEETPGSAEGPEVMSEHPCGSVDDCWVDGSTPIPRPEAARGRDFRPCEDGEAAPVCFEGRCGATFYGC